MHLLSLEEQNVHISGEVFHFGRGESIFTESSYKYTIEGFSRLAAEAGYRQTNCWTDAEHLFAVLHLVATE
jgi:uncharacterized SAM-dependent methyltransferase